MEELKYKEMSACSGRDTKTPETVWDHEVPACRWSQYHGETSGPPKFNSIQLWGSICPVVCSYSNDDIERG